MSDRKPFNAKSVAVSCLAVACGLLFQPARADAGWLSGFSGWTMMSDSGTATEVVNFAVYNNTSGDWATTLGVTPTAGADTSATYVYMYEVVNVGGATSKIGYFNINSGDLPYTSAGWLSGKVFTDGSPVGPSGNQYLGTDPGSTPPDDKVDGSPSFSGLTLTGSPFVSNVSAVDPFAADAGGISNSDVASFGFLSGLTQTLISGKFSSVLFLTSNTNPNYSAGSVLNTQTFATSNGDVPTQAPEPGTLAIWGFGLAGLGLIAARRRQKAAA